jgi:lipopolysaccharide transport system ATP-binding protein
MTRRRNGGDLDTQEFWAVRDVSFQVGPGEALGVIGPNGAGKSTILKLLTRILRPTRGHCEVRGRAGALIEVAAGFHPDLTGRENVYLQGAIMGMKQAEIARKFDAIVEFAGVSDFIDTPVKRYSSGMNARLGFAIAANLDPDVMIIDEVLSVGDSAFQEKCVKRMHAMIKQGIPVVFVSHNLPAVLELCTRVLVIGRGSVIFDGDPSAGIQAYRKASWTRDAAADEVAKHSPVRITAVELMQGDTPSLGVFRPGDPMTVRIRYSASDRVRRPHFAVDIHSADGIYCHGTGTFPDDHAAEVQGDGYVDLVFPRLSLLSGCYSVSAGAYRSDGHVMYDIHYKAYPFSVASGLRDHGFLYLEYEWRTEGTDAQQPEAKENFRSGVQVAEEHDGDNRCDRVLTPRSQRLETGSDTGGPDR